MRIRHPSQRPQLDGRPRLKIVFMCKTYSPTSVSKTHLKHAWALRPTAEGRRGPEVGPLGWALRPLA